MSTVEGFSGAGGLDSRTTCLTTSGGELATLSTIIPCAVLSALPEFPLANSSLSSSKNREGKKR
jgi:hypothetical protein